MAPYPKIELHVHFEGTVRPDALPDGVLYRDLDHFLEAFVLITDQLVTRDDFRRLVVDYAAEAATHGCVYIEGIFAPGLRSKDADVVFGGYCDGAEEAKELTGVDVRLTPDIPRVYTQDEALETVRFATKYRDRGVVGIGLGGPEVGNPPERYARAFEVARAEGLASVPHAGEHDDTIRGAIDVLGAHRIRHGIRAVRDPGLMRELADREIVLDVCPISNVRTRAVPSLEEHPLPQLVAAGIRCSISTDDPALFDTDLTRDYEAAHALGLHPRDAYEAALAGALCDEETRARLAAVGTSYDWDAVSPLPSSSYGQS